LQPHKLKSRKAYKPKKDCNGCGSGWSAKIIPNTIYGLNVRPVCCVHDDRYEQDTKDENYRLDSDLEMLENLLITIENKKSWYYPHYLARHRALGYYDAVRRGGKEAFLKNKGVNHG